MSADPQTAVAVVGMACRLPGAAGLGRYWAGLRAGFDGLTRFGPDELIAAGLDSRTVRDPDFVPVRGMLEKPYGFDWRAFGYSRAEAAGIDPQQRVLLECAAAALDDAGLDPGRFPGWIGVYGGVDQVGAGVGAAAADALAGVIGREKDYAATRVAYRLGLRGPAITVQTACSTSLTAVHMAVQSLLGFECDAALAGGATVGARSERGYRHAEGGIVSRAGLCRPFDAAADGTVPSDGVGVVVLRRLADALRDGDRIAAVILGSAVNNDGADKVGFTAPSVSGQRDVIRYALKVSGIEASEVDYVEAHGTGTRMGDPVEVQALTDAFRDTDASTGRCLLGAVKGNIGHTGAASGVAGLIKTALMLEHRLVVPTAHYTAPNPLLGLESTPFRISTRTEPWPDRGVPTAAVSSFGVGGTNAHVVLQAAPERAVTQVSPGPRVFVLSAASRAGLDRLRTDLADHVESQSQSQDIAALASAARTLAGRRVLEHRQAFVVREPGDCARALRDAPSPPAPVAHAKAAFLFPGQGTLRHAAGAAAYRLLPVFRSSFDEIAWTLDAEHSVNLSPAVTAGTVPAEWFTDTVNQQLGLLALGYALGRQLAEWGVQPVAMLGNSIGEYVAATLAGMWTPADAARLVYRRASAMRASAPGRMAAVSADRATVASRIGATGVEIAVVGPAGVVVSGPQDAMAALLAGDAFAGLEVRRLETRHAFHTAAMADAAESLREAAARVPARAPALAFVSNVTGGWADPATVVSPDYLAAQLRNAVQLDEGIATVLAADCDTYLELGPGTSMAGSLRRHRNWRSEGAVVPMLGRPDDDGEQALFRALAALWERGFPVDPGLLSGGDAQIRISLPPRAFDNEDPEISAETVEAAAAVVALGQAETALETRAVRPAPALLAAVARRLRPARLAIGSPGDVDTRTGLERLWCQTLGVAEVRDGDDFLALGGESLMAVGMLNRIGTVTTADFLAQPTFGNLVLLAGKTEPVPGLVTLRPGSGVPLFLLSDALGTAAVYRALTGEMDRPVFGLEAARTGAISDLAARHAESIIKARPHGPYLVGGWSFGAVAAHATARRLAGLGHDVSALVLLDGYPPDTGGRPAAADPGYLADCVRMQAAALAGVGPVGRQVRRAPGLRRMFAANIGSLLRYRPEPVPCPTVLFKAGVDRAAAERLNRRLAGLHPGGLTVVPVGGGHWSMLAPPHVRNLAGELRRALPPLDGEPAGNGPAGTGPTDDGPTSDEPTAIRWSE